MELLTLLLKPEILAIFGPTGSLLLVGIYQLHKMYKQERDKVNQLQEEKFLLASAFFEKYHSLVSEVERTLDRTLDHLRSK